MNNTSDEKQFAKLMKGLFPTITREQIDVIASHAIGLPMARACAVAKTHSISHSFLDMPQLIEGLRQAWLSHEKKKDNERNETIIYFVRRTARERGDTIFDGKEDMDVLRAHFTEAWIGIKEGNADPGGKEFARGTIYTHCLSAAEQIGMDGADAMALAEEVVDLPTGQKVEAKDFKFGAAVESKP